VLNLQAAHAFDNIKSTSTPATSYQFGQSKVMETSIKNIRHDPDNATITLMKGNLYAYSKAIPADRRHKDKILYQSIALDFVDHYRHLFKLHKPREELVASSIQIDNLDYKHVRLQQVYQGVPVWGSELIVHINTDEVVYLAGGHYIPSPDKITLKPAFNEVAALDYAGKMSADLKRHCARCTAQLVIYFDETISPRLAYFIEDNSRFSSSAQLMLDAHTGELLTHIPRIQT
jgi:Zn-dependent metalloprotease